MLSGCLPSSCQRDVSRALLPADSLSRRVAAQVPVDTLRALWKTDGSPNHPLDYPRTVRYGPDGGLYVTDTRRNSLFVFSNEGALVREVLDPSFTHPYLAGLRGDTAVVFNPDAHRFDFVVGHEVVRSVLLAGADTLRKNTLQYALATDDGLIYKAISKDYGGFIAMLGPDGRARRRVRLPGSYWHHAGQLRRWDGRIVSLSGFRPVVHTVDAQVGTSVDSLRLTGFDSPMLYRTRAFIDGEIRKAPLLSASSDPAGDLLFSLNMRPGWLRIDAFDERGRLQYRLVEPSPRFDQDYYPLDIAARRVGEQGYEIAVVTIEPEPQLLLYRWEPPQP